MTVEKRHFVGNWLLDDPCVLLLWGEQCLELATKRCWLRRFSGSE